MTADKRWVADLAWLGGDELASDVLIETKGGVIFAVTPDSREVEADRLGGIVVPGLVSSHSHAFHRALRGRTRSGGDFWAWRKMMYQLANRLNPGTYHELATAVFTEMLASGITTVGEFHYLHHQPDGAPYDDPNAMGEALISAAQSVGIRLTLLDTAHLQSNVEGDPPTIEQQRFSDGSVGAWAERVNDLLARYQGYLLVRIGVAAHSVRAVSPDDIKTIGDFARQSALPIHIHVSEQPTENAGCLEEHGMSPIALLERSGLLGSSTTLIHGTHVTPQDIATTASSGSGVCFCPTTEADLGDGIGPAIEYAGAGVSVSLGSDSNSIIDIFEEARRLEHHDRLRLGRRAVHSPASLLQAATLNGAKALAWDETGSIEPGFVADLVVLDPSSTDLAGVGTSVSGVVMAASRASVGKVIVGGEELSIDTANLDEIYSGIWK